MGILWPLIVNLYGTAVWSRDGMRLASDSPASCSGIILLDHVIGRPR